MNLKQTADKLCDNIEKVIVGKRDVTQKIVIAFLSGGHILLEDIPGTGKTTLCKALALSVDCSFKRIQFTPDLLPSELTGISFFNAKLQEFEFKPGSLFANIILADEINRATPRTQSSLLECMEEGQVSVDGKTYILDKPFLVIATQNPIEIQGTFPLPEAQLDRFLMRLSMGYPDKSSEITLLSQNRQKHTLTDIKAVLSGQDIIEAQNAVRDVTVSEPVMGYIVDICNATRTHDKLRLGVSPRGTLALMRAAQSRAGILGRTFVLPDDVKAVCIDVLAHRLMCRGFSTSSGTNTAHDILAQLLVELPAPVDSIG